MPAVGLPGRLARGLAARDGRDDSRGACRGRSHRDLVAKSGSAAVRHRVGIPLLHGVCRDLRLRSPSVRATS